jgi:predicted MFS family arabinose efflux permease
VREVLKLPAYRRLLVGYTFTQLAWWVGTLALAVLVYRHTGSAVGSTAFFLAAQFIPALISPALVARIDHYPAGRVLPVLYALEAVAFALLAWVASHFALAPVLVVTAIDGIIALAARAITRASTVAVTAPVRLLRQGNALLNGAMSACYFVGPALGAVVANAGGTSAALLMNAGAFVVITATLATAKGLPGVSTAPLENTSRLRAALAHARERPRVRALLGMQAAALVFFTISVPVEVVFAVHTLHAGRSGYAALISVWGAGTVIGSAVYARWLNLSGRTLIALGAACLGAGFLVMAVAPNLGVAVVGAAIGGIGNGVEAVAARTSLQEHVEDEWMALIMSLNESLFQAMPGAGILIGGAITALAGTRAALATGAAGALAVTALAWMLLEPDERIASRGSPAAASRR